jgi:predicted component of type VI protein secretion system
VTKLLIYRGDALHGEYELKGQTVHIGRSPQNDIVLEDPSKGVSRQHAELRAEGAHYMLVDLESQNGIWVHGSRVPSVRLDPGVTAALGPFRLTTVEAADSPAPAPGEFVTEPTEYSRPEEARPAPQAVDGPGVLLDGAATPPAGVTATPQAVPVVHAASAATSQEATEKSRAAADARKPGGGASKSLAPVLVAAAAVVLLIGASGFGAYAWLHKRAARPVWDRDVATALVSSGKCDEAMREQIGPALNANPNDAEALALKAQCAPPPSPPTPPSEPAPPTPPAEKTVAEKLDAVEAAIAAKDCQTALDAANAILAATPDDARAKDLAARADACLKPAEATPAAPSAPAAVVRISPSQGGLDVLPGETQREYTKRVAAMRKRFEDAAALLQGQHYQQAAKEFDAIAAVVPSGYLDLAQKRADTKAGMKDEASRVYASGRQAEQQGDLTGALQRYQRAHDADPSIDVTADVARVNSQKLTLGQQACKLGDANYALGQNAEATAQYQRVLEFLPDTEACYARAKTRIKR